MVIPLSAGGQRRSGRYGRIAGPGPTAGEGRVNGVGTEWHDDDLAAACEAGPDAILVPKVSTARAVLGLSQDQLAVQIGLTQRSVHRIEQGEVQPKVRTIVMIERFLTAQGIAFENLRDGGFRLIVETAVLLRD